MVFGEVGWSAMKILKRRGAAIAPCGNPAFIVNKDDKLVRYRTANCCSVRYDWKIKKNEGGKIFFNLKRRPACHTPGQRLARHRERLRYNIAFFPAKMKLYPLYN